MNIYKNKWFFTHLAGECVRVPVCLWKFPFFLTRRVLYVGDVITPNKNNSKKLYSEDHFPIGQLNIRYTWENIFNKNAFQWDAYRPLVDHIPACTGQEGCVCIPACTRQGVCVSQHVLGRGVSAQGVSARGLGVCLGGVCPQECLPGGCLPTKGVYLEGGVCPHGSVCPGEVSAQGVADTTPLWTDRHLWKHNLRKLCLRAVKNYISNSQ